MICEWNLILLVRCTILDSHDIVWKKAKRELLLRNFPTRLKCYLGDWLTVKDDNSIIFSDALQLFTRNFFPQFSLNTKAFFSMLLFHMRRQHQTCLWNIWKPLGYEQMRKSRFRKSFSLNAFQNPWWKSSSYVVISLEETLNDSVLLLTMVLTSILNSERKNFDSVLWTKFMWLSEMNFIMQWKS